MIKTDLSLEEVEEVIREYTALRRELAKENGEPTVRAVFASLFEFPGVKSASWKQYTPYFNDGEPCEFRVSNYLEFNGYDEEEDELGIGFDAFSIPDSISSGEYVEPEPEPDSYYTRIDSWLGRDRMPEWRQYQQHKRKQHNYWRDNGWTTESLKPFKEAIKTIEYWLGDHEDFLLDAFGDHVKVTVHQNGSIEVDEYEHD